MTENERKRSRRRFLADMLFLGGGVSAAALLAKHQFMDKTPDPAVAGAMEVPQVAQTPAPVETSCPVPESTQCPAPMPGEPAPPQAIDGDYALPEPPQVKGDVKSPPPPPQPVTGGKPVMPSRKSSDE